jgi:pyridoxamine 5'-phosphate oxidase-like protein
LSARTLLKERRTLDAHCRAFIAHSPFVLIATAGADGRCDVSPKGDAPALRSRLWAYEGWPTHDGLASYACVLFDQIRPEGVTVQDYEREIAESNVTRLY